MLELWTEIDYQMSSPCIDSLVTSPKESHGGPGTKRAVLDQRLVCEVVRILYKRFNFVKIQYNSSASSNMIMLVVDDDDYEEPIGVAILSTVRKAARLAV